MSKAEKEVPMTHALSATPVVGRAAAELPPDVAGRPLEATERVLLCTDGTVTQILEAVHGEPLNMTKLAQRVRPPRHASDRFLACGPQERVLSRVILLCGARSARRLLYAECQVALDRLPPDLAADLLDTDTPLGLLLRRHRIETYREIIEATRRRAGRVGDHLQLPPSDIVLFRTYRIFYRGLPVALIKETFRRHTAAGRLRRLVPAWASAQPRRHRTLLRKVLSGEPVEGKHGVSDLGDDGLHPC
jgi:chorismate-pyruvate lyase